MELQTRDIVSGLLVSLQAIRDNINLVDRKPNSGLMGTMNVKIKRTLWMKNTISRVDHDHVDDNIESNIP